jgi:hypothetical protein
MLNPILALHAMAEDEEGAGLIEVIDEDGTVARYVLMVLPQYLPLVQGLGDHILGPKTAGSAASKAFMPKHRKGFWS